MNLKDFITFTESIKGTEQAFIEKLGVICYNHYEDIERAMRGLLVEACETCEFSSDELKIYRAAQEGFLKLLLQAQEEHELKKSIAKEKTNPTEPKY